VSDITLVTEYRRLVATFGWTANDFRRRNLEALEASFAPAKLKSQLRPLFSQGE
jgi:adenosine deaminase